MLHNHVTYHDCWVSSLSLHMSDLAAPLALTYSYNINNLQVFQLMLGTYLYEHLCIQLWTTHLNELLVAGVIFWQWGFAPYVSAEFLEGCIHCQAIQVSSSDGVFKNIIAPAADYSHKIALSRSPVAECSAGTYQHSLSLLVGAVYAKP